MAIDRTEVGLYGIGRGAAQVWGENRALNDLQRAVQQDKIFRQKQEEQLSTELGKINIDAAREADLPELMKKYDGLKDTFYKLGQTRDNMERLKLQSQIMSQKQQLLNGVGLSKKAQQEEDTLGKLPLTHADDVVDNFGGMFSKLRGTSIFSPDYRSQAEQLTANALLPKFDNLGYQKKLLESSIENISTPERTIKNGRLNRIVADEGTRLNYDNVLNKTKQAALQDPRFRRNLLNTYQGVNPEQAVELYARDIYDQNKDAYNKVVQKTKGQYTDEADWRSRALFQDALIRGRQTSASETINPQVDARKQWIQDIKDFKTGAAERLGSYIESSPEFNFVKTAPNGDKERGNANSKFAITRDPQHPNDNNYFVLDIPARFKLNAEGEVVAKQERSTVKFNRKSEDFEQKMNDLISNVTGQRMDIGYSTGLKGNQKGKDIKVQSSSNKTGYSTNEENGIQAVMRSNGISRTEAINALRQAGKLRK